ncbi:MAG: hypothetical protein DMF53_14950 [Acidobacteria bacterium]|nr:MAG: hypothetical protein DMF53_14950 [Acidobacteriota bacterium]
MVDGVREARAPCSGEGLASQVAHGEHRTASMASPPIASDPRSQLQPLMDVPHLLKVVALIERGLEPREEKRGKRFFDLADRLTFNCKPEEQSRLKEE